MWAIGTGSAAMVDFLIKHKAEVDVRAAVNDWGNQITSEPRAQYRPTGGLTPLLYATRFGCLDCVKSLLKAGADINRPTPDGVTPLMNAIDNLQCGFAKPTCSTRAPIRTWPTGGVAPRCTSPSTCARSARASRPVRRTWRAEGAAPREVKAALDLARRLLDMGVEPQHAARHAPPGSWRQPGPLHR